MHINIQFYKIKSPMAVFLYSHVLPQIWLDAILLSEN